MAVAFTELSFQNHRDILLGWIMGIGKRTEYRAFQTIQATPWSEGSSTVPSIGSPTSSAAAIWTVESLAHQVCVAVVLALNPTGWLYLLVADTLLHQRGKLVHQAALQSAKPAPYNGDERPIAWDLIGLRGRERRATMTVESEEAGLTDLLIRWEELGRAASRSRSRNCVPGTRSWSTRSGTGSMP